MKNNYIPYGKQCIDQEDINAVIDVLKSDFITQGPKIDEFEKKFSTYVGAKYAVAFNSGTAALHASMFAIGIKEGDEVITTPNTFCATSNSVLYQQGTPVFCDISLNTFNIDEDKIESLITEKTRAIVPVHFAGHPCHMDKIREIAKKHNLKVVEDACHALGAVYKDEKIGSISDITCFSFHPVKHITTGEGGMAVTNSEELYKKLIQFRTHGITRDEDLLEKNEGPWFYEMQFLGYNYRITDFQAALGLSQLKKIDSFVKKRNEIASIYYDKIKKSDKIILPEFPKNDIIHAYHLFVIRLKDVEPEYRKKVFEDLKANNIGVNVHYIPVYKHPYYISQGFGQYQEQCMNTEQYYNSCITLPVYPAMQYDDVLRVVDALTNIVL